MLISYFVLLVVLATGCLAANTRVLNGKPATPHQFPYHVGIYWMYLGKPSSPQKYYCGGTVVSERWVLTSAKCVPDLEPILVKAGKHMVDQKEDNEQAHCVVHRVYHPEWKPPIISKRLIAQNDLAMLKVGTPFDFNEYVSAARIPSASAFFELGSLAGWGSTSMETYVPNFSEELYYGYLQMINAQDCANTINEVVSRNNLSLVEISSNQICSRPINERFGTCLKDDGSAFVSKKNGKYVVIGVVADHILSCGTVGLPIVYTRVSAYSEWINEVIESS